MSCFVLTAFGTFSFTLSSQSWYTSPTPAHTVTSLLAFTTLPQRLPTTLPPQPIFSESMPPPLSPERQPESYPNRFFRRNTASTAPEAGYPALYFTPFHNRRFRHLPKIIATHPRPVLHRGRWSRSISLVSRRCHRYNHLVRYDKRSRHLCSQTPVGVRCPAFLGATHIREAKLKPACVWKTNELLFAPGPPPPQKDSRTSPRQSSNCRQIVRSVDLRLTSRLPTSSCFCSRVHRTQRKVQVHRLCCTQPTIPTPW